VLVAGSDDQGAFYGVQSLRQLVERGHGRSIQAVQVRDWPHKSFRGIKLYLPGRENFAFFKRFLRDFMALYKYNKLIVELNAAMRLDRHPELNTGWAEMARDLIYSRRDRSTGPNGEYQDSTHHDTGDGGILEKAEVADMVRWATEYNIEVIPELPSLTHSYYLLTSHRELAEIPDAEWPDTYCPSNPKSYELLFDVFDEYIDVMKPKLIHVGHDEWRMPCENGAVGRSSSGGRGRSDAGRSKDWCGLQVSDSRRAHARSGAEADPQRHTGIQLVLE
jgi:hexosaminidase